ncbi:MAG: response regulator [Candidatus Omnitrophica bacterium]|nr:response regulator [Candidatus Omnitrophota bacterium]
MIKLLVVDDEQGICDFISDFFIRRGHLVVATTDPRKAEALLDKEKPQIMLLDIKMAKMDGLQILKKVRSAHKDVKIIMVSVADDEATKSETVKLGADDFVSKPFTTDYLESVVLNKVQELSS